MGEDDELNRLDDEALMRALQAPGTPTELGEEERYVELFRQVHSGRGARRTTRVARRVGTGTALAVAIGVTCGGVAAAYTGSLPDPLQDFAHQVLGPVGAPPGDDTDRKVDPTARSPQPPPTVSATPSPSTSDPTSPVAPSPSDHGPPRGADADPSPAAGSPSAAASASPTTLPPSAAPTTAPPSTTPSPTDSPDAAPSPQPVASAVSVNGTTHKVDVGQPTVLSGVLTTSDGTPVAGVRVALQRRSADGWARVAKAVTDEAGSVSLTTPPVTENTAFRLRTGRIHSTPWRVVMHPLVTVTSADGPDGAVAITASTQGGQAGDRVRLLIRKKNGLAAVAEGFLGGADGSVQFQVTPAKRVTKYVVVLDKTASHTRSHAGIRVTRPS